MTPQEFRLSTITLVAVNLLIFAALLFYSGNNGHYYPLDDTYIHLSIARSLAEHGVWGISQFDPAAASSSPLFTVLMAVIFPMTPSPLFEYVPLLIGLFSVVAFSWLSMSIFAMVCEKPLKILIGGVSLSVVTPISVIAVVGMEHALQIVLFVWYAYFVSNLYGSKIKPKNIWVLAILSTAVATIRYEGLILVAMGSFLLILSNRPKLSLFNALAAVLPLAIIGFVWFRHGGWAVPNSILMKKILNHGSVPQRPIAMRTLGVSCAAVMALLGLQLSRRKIQWSDWHVSFSAISLAYSLILILTEATGWLYRYEAAAIAMNVVVFTSMVYIDLEKSKIGGILFVGTISVLLFRSVFSMQLILKSPADREWEHFGPARFVSEYYPRDSIIANDVGVLAWLNKDARVLDLAGLANNEMAELRMKKTLTPQSLDQWARNGHASLAIVQQCWNQVTGQIPDTWTLVSVWKGPSNYVFGDKYVAFYAINPEAAKRINDQMLRFNPPKGVAIYSALEPKSPIFHASQIFMKEKLCLGKFNL
jgi:hypothetical protein